MSSIQHPYLIYVIWIVCWISDCTRNQVNIIGWNYYHLSYSEQVMYLWYLSIHYNIKWHYFDVFHNLNNFYCPYIGTCDVHNVKLSWLKNMNVK